MLQKAVSVVPVNSSPSEMSACVIFHSFLHIVCNFSVKLCKFHFSDTIRAIGERLYETRMKDDTPTRRVDTRADDGSVLGLQKLSLPVSGEDLSHRTNTESVQAM